MNPKLALFFLLVMCVAATIYNTAYQPPDCLHVGLGPFCVPVEGDVL